ncbi:hypothetical protein K1719_006926 [Acacia pycnantha]|nr:hypothetical protein K1719_006926 [Acacia pycnantha]
MLVSPLKLFCIEAELSTKRTVKNRTACSEIPRETQFRQFGFSIQGLILFQCSSTFSGIGRNNCEHSKFESSGR